MTDFGVLGLFAIFAVAWVLLVVQKVRSQRLIFQCAMDSIRHSHTQESLALQSIGPLLQQLSTDRERLLSLVTTAATLLSARK